MTGVRGGDGTEHEACQIRSRSTVAAIARIRRAAEQVQLSAAVASSLSPPPGRVWSSVRRTTRVGGGHEALSGRTGTIPLAPAAVASVRLRLSIGYRPRRPLAPAAGSRMSRRALAAVRAPATIPGSRPPPRHATGCIAPYASVRAPARMSS